MPMYSWTESSGPKLRNPIKSSPDSRSFDMNIGQIGEGVLGLPLAGRLLTSTDVVFCLLPIGLFLSIVSLV